MKKTWCEREKNKTKEKKIRFSFSQTKRKKALIRVGYIATKVRVRDWDGYLGQNSSLHEYFCVGYFVAFFHLKKVSILMLFPLSHTHSHTLMGISNLLYHSGSEICFVSTMKLFISPIFFCWHKNRKCRQRNWTIRDIFMLFCMWWFNDCRNGHINSKKSTGANVTTLLEFFIFAHSKSHNNSIISFFAFVPQWCTCTAAASSKMSDVSFCYFCSLNLFICVRPFVP